MVECFEQPDACRSRYGAHVICVLCVALPQTMYFVTSDRGQSDVSLSLKRAVAKSRKIRVFEGSAPRPV
jgi:hypothetical protein